MSEQDRIDLDQITREIQLRHTMSEETIEDYREGLKNKASSMPPVIVYHDEKTSEFFLADGLHRVAAARRNEQTTITAEIRPGTERDAILFAASSNSKHGLRRTNKDKRRTVETLLKDVRSQAGHAR